jgi:hypothetical protein
MRMKAFLQKSLMALLSVTIGVTESSAQIPSSIKVKDLRTQEEKNAPLLLTADTPNFILLSNIKKAAVAVGDILEVKQGGKVVAKLKVVGVDGIAVRAELAEGEKIPPLVGVFPANK